MVLIFISLSFRIVVDTAFDIDDPMIRDDHPVGVAADVIHHLLWSCEGSLAETTHSEFRTGSR